MRLMAVCEKSTGRVVELGRSSFPLRQGDPNYEIVPADSYDGHSDIRHWEKIPDMNGIRFSPTLKKEVETADAAREQAKKDRLQDIHDNVTSLTRAQIINAVNNISNLNDAKVFLKRLAIAFWASEKLKDS